MRFSLVFFAKLWYHKGVYSLERAYELAQERKRKDFPSFSWGNRKKAVKNTPVTWIISSFPREARKTPSPSVAKAWSLRRLFWDVPREVQSHLDCFFNCQRWFFRGSFINLDATRQEDFSVETRKQQQQRKQKRQS